MAVRFEWDPAKAAANERKHRVTFDDAQRIFNDPNLQSRIDADSFGELRWQSLGRVGDVTLLLVVHTWHESDGNEIIRIISARRADRWERRAYERSDWSAHG